MAERSVLAAPRRRFSSLIKAALEGWLAMAGRSAANAPVSVSAVLIAPIARVRRGRIRRSEAQGRARSHGSRPGCWTRGFPSPDFPAPHR
jgi:hypothetical protein